MTQTQTIEGISIDEMPSLDSPLLCESSHSDPDNQECSVIATHRSRNSCRSYTVLVCAKNIEFVRWVLEDPEVRCANCLILAKDCWTFFPLS